MPRWSGHCRVALAITPANNPFEPVVIRRHVTQWIEGAAAWEIIDRLATKYTGQPYPPRPGAGGCRD
jgi:hypothetical protein